jgi:hypothetical protein
MIYAEIWDRLSGVYTAFITETHDIISTRNGAKIGVHREDGFHDLNQNGVYRITFCEQNVTQIGGTNEANVVLVPRISVTLPAGTVEEML